MGRFAGGWDRRVFSEVGVIGLAVGAGGEQQAGLAQGQLG